MTCSKPTGQKVPQTSNCVNPERRVYKQLEDLENKSSVNNRYELYYLVCTVYRIIMLLFWIPWDKIMCPKG